MRGAKSSCRDCFVTPYEKFCGISDEEGFAKSPPLNEYARLSKRDITFQIPPKAACSGQQAS